MNRVLIFSVLWPGSQERERDKSSTPSNIGFTLLELLVVIGIIAVLSTIAMAALNTARAKARDTIRIHELRQVRDALDQYYGDYGIYPKASGAGNGVQWGGSWNNWVVMTGGDALDLKVVLKPYIEKLPASVGQNSAAPFGCCAYSYFVSEDGSSYDLIVILESDNKERCELKNWTSYTGGYIGIIPWYPGSIGASWCGASMSSFPLAKYIWADH